jgi:hypothetical protein
MAERSKRSKLKKLTAAAKRVNKRLEGAKRRHQIMATPEESYATKQAVDSRLAKAKSFHERLTGKPTSPGIKSEPQGTGLNVESKPRSQSASILSKQEAKLAERVQAHRAATPKKEEDKYPDFVVERLPRKDETPEQTKARQKQEKRNKDFLDPMKQAEKEGKAIRGKYAKERNIKARLADIVEGRIKPPEPLPAEPKSLKERLADYKAKKAEKNAPHKNLIEGMTRAAIEYSGPKKQQMDTAVLARGAKENARAVSKHINPYSGRTKESSQIKHDFRNGLKADADTGKSLDALGRHNLSGKDIDEAVNKANAPEKKAEGREKRIQKTQIARANELNKGLPQNSNKLVNPYSGRTKEKSFLKHTEATGKVIPKGSKRYNDKNDFSKGSSASKPKPQEAKKSSGIRVEGNAGKVIRPVEKKPSVATGGNRPPVNRPSVNRPPVNRPQPKVAGPATATSSGPKTGSTIGGILKATATHLGMAAMHGTNYPRVMAQHASQGPREFKPGWHGFTSPVERPKAEDATDTKGERA